MIWITHILGGVLSYILSYKLGLIPQSDSTLLTLFVFGSLLPDIDHPRSFISNSFLPFKIASYGVSTFGHRTIMHSFLGIGIWYVVFNMLFPLVGIQLTQLQILSILIGYVSHLILDSLTLSGVDWSYPLHILHPRFIIRTGGVLEIGFMGLLLLAIAYLTSFW